MNFPGRFVFLLQQCVQSARFSVNINGTLKGWFGSTRGLRQGDPISSYMFIIVLEVFNGLMREASQSAGFSFHHQCQLQQITQISFADDMVIVVSPTQQSIQLMQQCLDEFGQITGLKLNCAKSKIYFGSVNTVERGRICRLLSMEEGCLPMKYLGVPLSSGHLTCEDYRGLTDRICSKINSWQARHLSFGGRAQLVRSSIFGLQNFWCANLPITRYVIQEVEQLIRTFLWAGKGDGEYHAKVAWKTLCLPLKEGRLGFKCMITWSQVCLGKLMWNIASLKQTLWVQWVHSVRLKGGSVWAYRKRDRDPWYWNKILKVRPLVRHRLQVSVGNGSTVSFWHDPWCELGPVCDYLDAGERASLQVPSGAKLSEVEWVMPGARRQTIRVLQVRDCFVKLVFSGEKDQWRWGAGEFVQRQLWEDVRVRGTTVGWGRWLWSCYGIPRYAFIVWLLLQNRLSTKDRLCR
ncbi:reverse transcriptase [Lithospermum erythrorhizon]|uniref:Reverse transcriptase n=1 Tax=Lithospermum erythrorhizon TaxID=34254 RepID=A0AAV3RBU3_LITER